MNIITVEFNAYIHICNKSRTKGGVPHNSIHESNDYTNLLAIVPPCKQVIITQETLALAHLQAL